MGSVCWMLSEVLAGDIVAVGRGGSCMAMLDSDICLQDGVPGLQRPSTSIVALLYGDVTSPRSRKLYAPVARLRRSLTAWQPLVRGLAVSVQERVVRQVRQSQEAGTKQWDSARRCGPDGRRIDMPLRVMVWVCRWRGPVHLSSGKSGAGWVDELQWKNRKLAPLGGDCSTGEEHLAVKRQSSNQGAEGAFWWWWLVLGGLFVRRKGAGWTSRTSTNENSRRVWASWRI